MKLLKTVSKNTSFQCNFQNSEILTKLQKKYCVRMCFYIYMGSYGSIGHQMKSFIRELHGSLNPDTNADWIKSWAALPTVGRWVVLNSV